MAKVKLTKNELKLQRDALKRFERYLPTLQLKKQQLQLEVRKLREAMDKLRQEETLAQKQTDTWAELFDEQGTEELGKLVVVREFRVGIRNVAGIDTPVFEGVDFESVPYDLFATPLWYDDAVAAVRKLIEFRLRHRTMEQQLELLEQELRVVTQRVNLFEKVKIPEARENIRRIQIYLGDQQTSAVGRAKLAKTKCEARDEAMTLANE
jgi:V/A-type H+-transporting ATPase subunit D